MQSAVTIRYYYEDACRDGPDTTAPVATLESSARFQATHLLADMGLRIARQFPEIGTGEYPATLEWSNDGDPVVRVLLPNGRRVEHTYLQGALLGTELIRSRRPDLLAGGKQLVYIAGPSDHVGQRRPPLVELRPTTQTADIGDHDGLRVNVEHFAAGDPVALDDMLCLGATHGAHSDLAVVCDLGVLDRLANDERACSPDSFTERGWWLLGRVLRVTGSGMRRRMDLVLFVDDAVAMEAATSTAATLTMSIEGKCRISDEVRRRAAEGREQRLVGWCHTHNLAAIAPDDAADRPTDTPAAAPSLDGRFFSALDERLHRKDFGPMAVALVLDAHAARHASNPARVFAAFGTIDGVVVRRAIYLSQSREERDVRQTPASHTQRSAP